AEVGPWELANKDYPADPVTLRLLLSHTAGTSDFRYSGYRYGYYRTPPGPIDRIPTMYQELNGLPPANTPAIAVIRKPGVTWHYSAPGFTVVQALLMDIYHQDFASIMQQLVLAPLGMSDSTFVQPVPEDLIPRMAVPYLPDGHRLPDGPRVFNSAASGGLVTTPTDLAKFVIAVQKALKGETQGGITSRIAHQVMERQPGRLEPGSCLETADAGVRACQSSWGLGFDVNVNRYSEHQKDGAPTGGYFEHTGFNSGFLALMMGRMEQQEQPSSVGVEELTKVRMRWSCQALAKQRLVPLKLRGTSRTPMIVHVRFMASSYGLTPKLTCRGRCKSLLSRETVM